MRQIIVISGAAGSGKDTAANILSSKLQNDGYKVIVTHFADLLKYICRTFFNWDGRKDEKGRTLLQRIGTDVIRKRFPDLWVDFISDMLTCFADEWDYAIVADARFPNEVDKLKENFDVVYLRIESNRSSRLTQEQQAHSSEAALDNVPADYNIKNDDTILILEKRLNNWMEEYIYDCN